MSWSTRTVLTLAIVAVFATVLGPSGGASRGRATTALDHRGGTLKLLAKSASGTIDPQVNYTLPYWQLYQASYDGLLAFKKAGGNAAFQVVPDIAQSIPTPTNGGKTLGVQDPQGDQVLERPDGDAERRRGLVPSHLQGQEPDLGNVLRRHRRRAGVPRHARRPAR